MSKEYRELLFNAKEYEAIEVGRNKIHRDGNLYIVEQYEFTDADGEDYFSCYDGYEDIDEAIKVASKI